MEMFRLRQHVQESENDEIMRPPSHVASDLRAVDAHRGGEQLTDESTHRLPETSSFNLRVSSQVNESPTVIHEATNHDGHDEEQNQPRLRVRLSGELLLRRAEAKQALRMRKSPAI